MAAFDAELYLRLLGETTLAESYGEDPDWASPLGSVARALRAVGAIGEDAARAVIDDYRLAVALRDGEEDAYGFRWQQAGPAPAEAPRLVRSNRVIEHRRGLLHVRHVRLTTEAT